MIEKFWSIAKYPALGIFVLIVGLAALVGAFNEIVILNACPRSYELRQSVDSIALALAVVGFAGLIFVAVIAAFVAIACLAVELKRTVSHELTLYSIDRGYKAWEKQNRRLP